MIEPPFATVDELRDRWPDFPAGGDRLAEVTLEDASQFILDVCPLAANAPEATLRRVVCAVVRRAMQAATSDLVGLASTQVTTGPFQATYSPANPNGDFYLTKQELKALGGEGRPRAYSVSVGGERDCERHQPWCDLTFGRACSCGADLTRGDPLWEY